jgi:hypothetical protein
MDAIRERWMAARKELPGPLLNFNNKDPAKKPMCTNPSLYFIGEEKYCLTACKIPGWLSF